MSTVYVVSNIKTDKKYIGSTNQDLKIRLKRHIACCKRGDTTPFYNHMRETGYENWNITPLRTFKKVVSQDQLKRSEGFYQRKYLKSGNLLNVKIEHGRTQNRKYKNNLDKYREQKRQWGRKIFICDVCFSKYHGSGKAEHLKGQRHRNMYNLKLQLERTMNDYKKLISITQYKQNVFI